VRPGGAAGEPWVADFREAPQAFAFAQETFRMAARFNERHADSPLAVRLGIHFDTVWFVGDEVIGDALAVAVHLAGAASAGTVCASAEALSRLGETSVWELTERGSTRAPGVERDISILEGRLRPAALAPEKMADVGELPPPPRDRGLEAPPRGETTTRPSWANVPLPPRPPSLRTPGQDIVAGLAEIGRAVVNELAERSKGVTEEKVRAAIRRSAVRWEHGYRQPPGETEDSEQGEPTEAEGQEQELPVDFLQERKKRASTKAGRALAGFVSHATAFALVGGGLVALNVLLTGGFPWAFFPVAGWGIGLVCHLRAMVSSRRKARQLRGLDAVSREQLGLVEKIQRAASGFGGHTAAYLAVNGFLAGINLITSAGHLWFLYPALAWGIGYVMHWTGYLARKAALVRRLWDAGLSWPDIRAGKKVTGGHAAASAPSQVTPSMEYAELVRDAAGIRDGLLRQLVAHEEIGKRMGSDVAELLTTYSEQLDRLVLRNDEFRRTLESLPEPELEREIADYRARVAGNDPATLRQEYQKAAEQGERQLKSVRELKHQKEILGVRIRSSFGLLKQLELDFVRLKNAASSDDLQGLASIRSKSHEISDYLEGLDEVEKDG
jgi:hypothetical protein